MRAACAAECARGHRDVLICIHTTISGHCRHSLCCCHFNVMSSYYAMCKHCIRTSYLVHTFAVRTLQALGLLFPEAE